MIVYPSQLVPELNVFVALAAAGSVVGLVLPWQIDIVCSSLAYHRAWHTLELACLLGKRSYFLSLFQIYGLGRAMLNNMQFDRLFGSSVPCGFMYKVVAESFIA